MQISFRQTSIRIQSTKLISEILAAAVGKTFSYGTCHCLHDYPCQELHAEKKPHLALFSGMSPHCKFLIWWLCWDLNDNNFTNLVRTDLVLAKFQVANKTIHIRPLSVWSTVTTCYLSMQLIYCKSPNNEEFCRTMCYKLMHSLSLSTSNNNSLYSLMCLTALAWVTRVKSCPLHCRILSPGLRPARMAGPCGVVLVT